MKRRWKIIKDWPRKKRVGISYFWRKNFHSGADYWAAHRSLDWWRGAIDEAEKSDKKYVTFAELIMKVEKENLTHMKK